MKKLKDLNPAMIVSGCLGLDLIAIGVLIKLLINSSNIGLMIIFMVFIYGICVDALKAITYLIMYYKMYK